MKRSRDVFENLNSFDSSSLYFEDEEEDGRGEDESGILGNEVYIPDVDVDDHLVNYNNHHHQHHHTHHYQHQSPTSFRKKNLSLSSTSIGEMYMESSDGFLITANDRMGTETRDLSVGWGENNFDGRVSGGDILRPHTPPLQQTTNVNMNYIWNRDNVIYIGNLDSNITEQLLRKLFSTIGPISSLDLMKNRKSNKNRGICFITYATAEDALQAVNKYDGVRILSKDIFVRLARPHISFVVRGTKGTGKKNIGQQGNNGSKHFSDGDYEDSFDNSNNTGKIYKCKKLKSKLNDYPQNKKYQDGG